MQFKVEKIVLNVVDVSNTQKTHFAAKFANKRLNGEAENARE